MVNEGLRAVAKTVGGRGWQEVATLKIHDFIHELEPGVHPRALADPRAARDEKGSETYLLAPHPVVLVLCEVAVKTSSRTS